jgi:excinuclease ABC subunit C
MADQHITNILKTLPDKPGVYQHYDKKGTLIYVGKAKNIRKRVSSYFNKNLDSGKTRVLVSKIADIKYIVTPNELEALLLENNLIKENQPRYNVLLKDDKTYPWICIKKEPFPRIFSTRRIIKDGSEYYGPYPSGRVMKTLLDLIRQLYTLRTCNLALTEENITAGKFKVCLEYHLKNCLGPCEGYQTEGDYLKDIDAARDLIKGNVSTLISTLKKNMAEQAEALDFEGAQQSKEKMDLLQQYQAKSLVVNPKITDVDVYSASSDAQFGYVNFLRIKEGAVVQSHTIELKKKLEETDEELLGYGVLALREKFPSNTREIYLSHPVSLPLENIVVSVPQRGDKKSLIDLSIRNALFYRQDKLKNLQIVDPDRHVNRIMEQMKTDLRMPVEPRHIECFDNSNFQGTNAVAACVVFKDGKPSKKDYRHFNIKTVEGPDDYASMEEVVFRRYKRLLDEDQPLPQLIVIDGGKGQLGSALNALEKLDLRGKITIIGIAKRLEEIYFPGDSIPLYLDKKSESLKIIQQARNEAHRFGITHHRNKRSKSNLNSSLEDIQGIGPSTVKALLDQFKNMKRIREAE